MSAVEMYFKRNTNKIIMWPIARDDYKFKKKTQGVN